MSDEDDTAEALARIRRVYSTSAEVMIAFVVCAQDGIKPPQSLLDEADKMIAECLRYAGGLSN